DNVDSTGFDFEFAGELIPDVDVIANYNYVDTVISSSLRPVDTTTPTNQANLHFKWRPSWAPRFQLQAGAAFRSENYRAGTTQYYRPDGTRDGPAIPFEFVVPARTIYELGLDYDITENASLSLFIEN